MGDLCCGDVMVSGAEILTWFVPAAYVEVTLSLECELDTALVLDTVAELGLVGNSHCRHTDTVAYLVEIGEGIVGVT